MNLSSIERIQIINLYSKKDIIEIIDKIYGMYMITGTVSSSTSTVINVGDTGVFLPLNTVPVSGAIELEFNEFPEVTVSDLPLTSS